MDRVRARIADKRVLALVKAFLKAGVLTELGEQQDTPTGTPQGGILSPLLANIALSVLDDHLHREWQPGGRMSTENRRHYWCGRGEPTWRLVRYADDFVVMVFGARHHVEALHEQVTAVLAPIGLRLSPSKTRIVHMSEGFDFLGFHILWRRKKGTCDQWHVYTFIADRPVQSLKDKIRALTRRTSPLDLDETLIRINQITRGWAAFFRHAVAKHTFDRLAYFIWWRIVRWVKARRRWKWRDVHRWLRTPTGWRTISADGIELHNIAATPVTRYRRRHTIPSPWPSANHA